MATNFRISTHQNSDSLHLKLIGDFDGTSAYELFNVLNKMRKSTHRVFIHTSCLKEVHPFACGVFHSQLNTIRGQFRSLVFTGEHADRIAST